MSVADIFETMAYGPAPESDGPAREWLRAHAPRLDLHIGGRFVPPHDDVFFETANPASGETLIGVAQAGAVDVDDAVATARAAFETWSRAPGHLRARHLYALARMVQKHARLFAVLETLDNGKPIRESRDLDVPLAARHFYHHAGWAQLLDDAFPAYAPVGVVGAIIPWNFPLLMLAWKVAPALAAGNTIVLKPAEYTPLTALLFAELAARAGLPPGVLNVITGDGQTGALLAVHAGIDKVAFTGSTEVGREIRRVTAGTGQRLSLELGGKSPFVVFDDADLDSVVEGVVDAIWFNQGQVCCAGSRLLAQESTASRLIDRLRARMERLRMGNPLDKAIDLGAIVAPVQLERIRRLVARGQEEGATLWQPSWACPSEGLFYPPTLLTNVAPASTAAQVEIFGPVLAMTTFRTKAEAIALANNTPYGLAASVWTENVSLALDVARAIKAGTIWVNCTNQFDAASGFGGYRESGFGREGGKEGLYEYLRPRWQVDITESTPSPTPPTLRAGHHPSPAGGRAVWAARSADRGDQSAWVGGEGLPAPDLESATKHDGAARGNEGVAASGAVAAERADAPVYPAIDRTPKLFIGGKQARPDSGYSRAANALDGRVVGEVGEGNRKDIRNAVEAAHAASGWAASTGHARAQILYYIAENLAARAGEFARRLDLMTGGGYQEGRREVEATLERLFTYAAWADKYDGAVHGTPLRGVTLALNEPVGVIGIACPDERPLLALVALAAPALAMGNTIVVVPSERHPLAAADLYQVLETSDVPAGVVNIVTGARDPLARVLAAHDDVDAVWYAGPPEQAREIELAAAGNLKRVWIASRPRRDWYAPEQGWGDEFLRAATQIKNVWLPSGD